MAANVGSTFLRIVLGAELTRLRERAGLTGAAAAAKAGCSASTISDVEQGKTGFRRIDHLSKLLEAYGVDEDGQVLIMDWHRQAKGSDWWTTSVSVLPSGMNLYLALESGAQRASAWIQNVILGLFQTEAYARALIDSARAANDTTSAFVENAVEVRMNRQRRITEEGMHLHCVMDESALRNMVGTAEIMKAQYQAITELATLPNITVQIIPFKAPTYRVTGGEFTILDFDSKKLPGPVVATSTVDASLRIGSKDPEVKRFGRRFEFLTQGALPAYETPKFLAQLAREV